MLRAAAGRLSCMGAAPAACPLCHARPPCSPSPCSAHPSIPQLSWLTLWAILLGCDDFHSKEELVSGQRHRRPGVADMADVGGRLASIAAQIEVRAECATHPAAVAQRWAAGGTACLPACLPSVHRCSTLPCLRPLPPAPPCTLLQALEGGLTTATLETPAGTALVQDCVELHSRLAALSRLDDPTLLPAVGGAGWWDPNRCCC